jgi:hypothetical protein
MQSDCCSVTSSNNHISEDALPPLTARPPLEDSACCGPSKIPAGSPFEMPGYQICSFVQNFQSTPIGLIPRIKTSPSGQDYLGTLAARVGLKRTSYRVAPGLYCIGEPSSDSDVVVTANYKLTFDNLRQKLAKQDLWLLVVDTYGINVWCAAGRGTFSTQEVNDRVKSTRLAELVQHRSIVLPQLAATGVCAREVKSGCGFKVIWGPIRSQDLKDFLCNGKKAGPGMRLVSFSFKERLVLVPVACAWFPFLSKKDWFWSRLNSPCSPNMPSGSCWSCFCSQE